MANSNCLNSMGFSANMSSPNQSLIVSPNVLCLTIGCFADFKLNYLKIRNISITSYDVQIKVQANVDTLNSLEISVPNNTIRIPPLFDGILSDQIIITPLKLGSFSVTLQLYALIENIDLSLKPLSVICQIKTEDISIDRPPNYSNSMQIDYNLLENSVQNQTIDLRVSNRQIMNEIPLKLCLDSNKCILFEPVYRHPNSAIHVFRCSDLFTMHVSTKTQYEMQIPIIVQSVSGVQRMETTLKVCTDSHRSHVLAIFRLTATFWTKTVPKELSSDSFSTIKSTPLIGSKQKTNNTSFELIVDTTHFDVSISKFCRSDIIPQMRSSEMKTTIPITECSKTSNKTLNKSKHLNSYHMYRQSITSVQSLLNNSCQPIRTVIKVFDENTILDDINDQTIKSVFNDRNDLRSVFNQSLSTSMFSTSKLVSKGRQKVLSAKQKVLLYCEPTKVIDFETAFDKKLLKQCRKIGEGSYGEVFASKDSDEKEIVIKIVALIQNENQKEEDVFSQFLPELVVSLNFNRLKAGVEFNSAPNFIDMIKASVTSGVFPSKLLEEWDKFDDLKTSENEDPRNFPKDQHFIVFHLANGGTDLESCQLTSAIESLSIFIKLSLALAAAEQAFQFEHRDLHWGNVLVSHTNQTQLKYRINGKVYEMTTNGVFASIIDFSLSRMTDKEFIIFDDLAKYSDLFEGTGDYQFDIYRMMKEVNQNDWKQFVPKTNIFWLHYILDKTIFSKKYPSYRTKRHKDCIDLLKTIKKSIIDFKSCVQLIESPTFDSYLSKL